MRSPRVIYEMLRTGYEQRVAIICERIEKGTQQMTCECSFCEHKATYADMYDTDAGWLCHGCMLWFEVLGDGVDYPEDFDYDGDY